VIVTLTFWRPQRRPAPGEPGYVEPPPPQTAPVPQTAWIDVGGLNYVASPADRPSCPENAYTVTEPSPLRKEPGLAHLIDEDPDRRADPANTLSYTLNLTECLASRNQSFNPGEQRLFSFAASPPTSSDRVLQWVSFRREDGQ
jgi:hypothetical protein